MARVQLELPEQFMYATELEVRIGDINYAGHLGNEALMLFLQEARERFLAQYGMTEREAGGASLVMADTVVVYRSEAFHKERLRVDLALRDFNRYGFDVVYRVGEAGTGREVARAKTGVVFFDYATRTIQRIPPEFLDRLRPDTRLA